jgi:CRISP-associated protein Cas1
MLESQVRIQSITEGYDPTLGIMHESREGSSAFVFDLMEPERPKVHRSVLEFVKAHKCYAADFVIRTDGVCRLNPAPDMKSHCCSAANSPIRFHQTNELS